MESAIDAVNHADGARLASLFKPTQGPCEVNPVGIVRAPACHAGTAPGTLVPAQVFGTCPDEDIGYLDPSLTDRIRGWPLQGQFVGVLKLDRGPVRYAALFASERVLWLAFNQDGNFIGIGGGSICPTDALRPRMGDAQWLSGPNWPN